MEQVYNQQEALREKNSTFVSSSCPRSGGPI